MNFKSYRAKLSFIWTRESDGTDAILSHPHTLRLFLLLTGIITNCCCSRALLGFSLAEPFSPHVQSRTDGTFLSDLAGRRDVLLLSRRQGCTGGSCSAGTADVCAVGTQTEGRGQGHQLSGCRPLTPPWEIQRRIPTTSSTD